MIQKCQKNKRVMRNSRPTPLTPKTRTLFNRHHQKCEELLADRGKVHQFRAVMEAIINNINNRLTNRILREPLNHRRHHNLFLRLDLLINCQVLSTSRFLRLHNWNWNTKWNRMGYSGAEKKRALMLVCQFLGPLVE